MLFFVTDVYDFPRASERGEKSDTDSVRYVSLLPVRQNTQQDDVHVCYLSLENGKFGLI